MCKSTPVIKYPIAPWRLQRATKGWRSLEPEADTFQDSWRRKGVDENILQVFYAFITCDNKSRITYNNKCILQFVQLSNFTVY